jgi:hypothetical protein
MEVDLKDLEEIILSSTEFPLNNLELALKRAKLLKDV